jgi:hypothetical protein
VVADWFAAQRLARRAKHKGGCSVNIKNFRAQRVPASSHGVIACRRLLLVLSLVTGTFVSANAATLAVCTAGVCDENGAPSTIDNPVMIPGGTTFGTITGNISANDRDYFEFEILGSATSLTIRPVGNGLGDGSKNSTDLTWIAPNTTIVCSDCWFNQESISRVPVAGVHRLVVFDRGNYSGPVGDYELSFSYDLTTTAVPVPAAAWLFGSALGLLGWMKRKQA